MSRDEVKKIIQIICTTYPNYKPDNLSNTVDVWAMMLEEFTYQEISVALKAYILTDTSGFAPSVGALVAKVRRNVCHARGGAVSGYVRNRRFVEADNWLKDEISIEELDRRAIEAWNNRATEAEIRAKAIDEMVERIKIHTRVVGTTYLEDIDEIAEQLKERE